MHVMRPIINAGILATLFTTMLAAVPASADTQQLETRVAETRVEYKIILPDGFDPGKDYPGVLIFDGGPQTMRTIDSILSRGFRRLAETRGYIVVAPSAPNDALFFRGGERIFPAFLDELIADYNIRGNKFHVAGPSNGGIAAFHVAALHPGYFYSVTAYPGHMWQATPEKLESMADLCVFTYIGENDEYRWHDKMRSEIAFLDSLGTIAEFTLEVGQSHRLTSLAGSNANRLFENFERAEKGCRK